jgi:SAM-dependent methyltransferase
MTMYVPPRRCPACGTPPRPSFRLHNGAQLLRCPRCLLGWWNWPAPDPGSFYDRDYFQSDEVAKGYDDYRSLEPALGRTSRARLRRIGGLLSPDARAAASRPRLLDLGCAAGYFLDEARRANWEVRGVEVSDYAAACARARGLEVTCAPLEELSLPAAAFDCVTLWDVLEHVRDPADVLTAAARAVRPGGVVALSTGDITSLCARLSGPRWHLFNLPEHLFFFSPPALRRLLRRAGCQVRRITREVQWVPLAYVLERLRKPLRNSPPAKRRRRAPSWVVPATLFDILGVYAIRADRKQTS